MAVTEARDEVSEVLEGVDAPEWAEDAEVVSLMHDAEEETPPERFRVVDNGQADWAMRKLCHLAESSRLVEELAARQMEPIERWRQGEQARIDRERSFWESLLVEFHRGVIEEDPKATSVRLPHGTLKSRKLPDRWDFDDEVFIAWARDIAPELIRTKEEPDKALAKKALSVTGIGTVVLSLPEGQTAVPFGAVRVTAGERKFEVSAEEVGS